MQTKERARGPGRPQALIQGSRETQTISHHNRNRKKLPKMMNPGYSFFIDEYGIVQYRKKK